MRYLIYIFSTLVVLALLAAGAWFFYPIEPVLRDRLEKIANAAGYDLIVAGDMRLTRQLTPRLTMKGVLVRRSDKPKSYPVLTARVVSGSISLRALLRGRYKVDEIAIDEPNVSYRIDEKGDSNLAPQNITRSGPQNTIPKIVISTIRLRKGKVSYIDEQSKTNHTISDANATLKGGALDGPFTLTGNGTFKKTPFKLDGKVGSLTGVAGNKGSKVDANVASAIGSLALKGDIRTSGNNIYVGQTALKINDIGAAAGLFGEKSEAWKDGPKLFSLNGKTEAGRTALKFSNAKLSLDGTRAEGDVAVTFAGSATTGAGAKPVLTATLVSSFVDLDSILGTGTPARRSATRAPAAAAAAKPIEQVTAKALLRDYVAALEARDTVRRSAPRIRRRKPAWSTAPIAWPVQDSFGLNVTLAPKKLRVFDQMIENSRFVAISKDKQLVVNLIGAKTLGGTVNGRLTAKAQGSATICDLTLTAEKVQIQNIARIIERPNLAKGNATGRFDLTSDTCKTQRSLIAGLKGKGQLRLGDGAVAFKTKFDSILRWFGITSPVPFKKMDASFALAKGIATNSDLNVTGAPVLMNGRGQVRMPDKWVNFSAKFRKASSVKRTTRFFGFSPTLTIIGPWDALQYKVDIFQSLFRSPQALNDAIGQWRKENTLDPEFRELLDKVRRKDTSLPARSRSALERSLEPPQPDHRAPSTSPANPSPGATSRPRP